MGLPNENISHLRSTKQTATVTPVVMECRSASRRAFLHTLATGTIVNLLNSKVTQAATDVLKETFESPQLHVGVSYPKGWFRSERDGSIVMINVLQVIAATVSRRPVGLSPRPDPFSAAYDFVRDRIEKEGADIIIKEAAFDGDVLSFKFQAETLLPNGVTLVRLGIGRALPSTRGEDPAVCIVTTPKETWDDLAPIATGIVSSLRTL